jgi:hypothetical protein
MVLMMAKHDEDEIMASSYTRNWDLPFLMPKAILGRLVTKIFLKNAKIYKNIKKKMYLYVLKLFNYTTKLTTIERFFSTGFHEISAPKSHVLYQSYIKYL